MVSGIMFKKALREAVTLRIYSRGVDYYEDGMVRACSSEEHEDGTITVTGKVRGTKTYRVVLEVDVENKEIWHIECTCPYDGICKHAVALGLEFADSLEEKQLVPLDKVEARRVLAKLGIAADKLPDRLIESLLAYQKLERRPNVQKQKNVVAAFNPSDYFFTISKYNYFAPRFHKRGYSYQQTSINDILQRKGLTKAQRELLLYIKEGKFFGDFNSPRPDPGQLFPLFIESGFPVYDSYGYNKPLTIDLHPKPLQAEIVYKPFINFMDKSQVRHDFFMYVPKIYWGADENPWNSSPFTIYSSSLVYSAGEKNRIELHKLTPLLTGVFARLEPVFELNSRNVISYRTRLQGEELVQFDQLVNDAFSLLELTSYPPQFVSQKTQVKPQPSILVDLDNTSRTLRVVPAVDYGIHKQDISESMYMRRSLQSGNELRRRETFADPGEYIIRVVGNTIHYAVIEKKEEIAFYKELTEHSDGFGFTKTLKCQRKGENKITEYLTVYWPRLAAYAGKKGYPILYAKDSLPTESTLFRADFTADLNADNDWLYFDVTCYCGDERITLERLLAFIESGDRFWKQEDGTLVEIANRDELERLARMLKSFHARENGGFEGRLHHASELEYVMTSSKHYNAARAESFARFLKRIQEGKPVKEVRLTESIAPILRPYQKEGIEWLYFLRSYRFAGILADDMGLGKTLQTLYILEVEKVAGKPSLVICPKTLLYNWKKEAERFFPELSVLVYDGTPRERLEKGKTLTKYDVVVTSYGMLKQDEGVLLKSATRFNYAVLDEAQFIKNHATKNAQRVKQVNADYRLALTGTPLENSVSELWSMFDFLMPGFLGGHEQFSKNFHKPIMDQGDKKALEHLRSKAQPFMLRRTKSEVLKELPGKIEQMSQCQLTEEQNVLYQQILLKVRGEVFDAVKKKGFQSAQIHILAGLTKLRQVCNHPALLIKDTNFRKYESAKLAMCMELVEEVRAGGRKVLIFSQFTKMLDIVSASLSYGEIPHLYLSGKTKDRQGMVETFNTDPQIPVFLISLKAGGTGLNLTSADTVIIFDPWWNPSVENQAIDRTHRIGQTKTVNVYRLLTRGTIEEKIQALKQKKQQLFDSLVGESGDIFKKLTWEDVRGLFGL